MAFDLRSLIPVAGGMAPHGGNAFLRGWQRAQQEAQQKQAYADQQSARQEQLGFQRDANVRAQNADTRAQQDQAFQAVTSIRQLLGDESLDTPDAYGQREQFALSLAPRLGVDAGFVQSLRPTPDAFTKRKLKKVYGQFEKLPQGEREAFEQGGHWEIDGQTYTPASVRQALGFNGMTAEGKPFSFTPKPANTDKRGFATKDITVNGKRMLAGFDPDKNQYFAPGDTQTPLTGDIQEYQKPAQESNGLNPRQQSQASAQARTFETLPVVKNTQKISEAANFVNSMDLNTKNPADDQALIYAFAKAMDPDSVVREGEYATVQRYSQSWLQSFGFNAQRILSNSEFLAPQARANLKKTILAKFGAAKPQYDAVRKSYVTKINKITGLGDGEDWLTDYGSAFPSEPSAGPAPAAGGGWQTIGGVRVRVKP